MSGKPFFKPEDFNDLKYGPSVYPRRVYCERANQLLEAALAAAPRVYGKYPAKYDYIGNWANKETEVDTHTAVLFNIEPIAKEPCKHVVPKNYCSTDRIFCLHCGVELIAEWKAKGEV